MKSLLLAVPIFILGVLSAPLRAQQATSSASSTAAASPAEMQKIIEAYLRHLYAFASDAKLTIGPFKETGIPGLLETTIELKQGENKESAKIFVSKDGKYLFRGELSDLTKDPLAEARAKIQIKDAPMLGDAKASVTLVEYSDFECPVCRNLHNVLRGMLPNYPRLRVVFKDFPLEQLHPWARTAALAGRCAYQQDPKAFWKMYDLIYDGQDLISAENAWAKMNDFAEQSGLDAATFKSCLASPEAKAAVDASRANGQELEVTSTPTIFINGRRIVGVDPHLIEQYIQYELAHSDSTGKK